jgi:hypothetical protein
MNLDMLVEAELCRTDWNRVQEMGGCATETPHAVRELLDSRSPDDVKKAYWKLENHIVVQGQLFEAALYVVPVIVAALAKLERPSYVRIGLYELLFQIVNGEVDSEEATRGLENLGERCRELAREGLWIFYRDYFSAERDAAKEVIALLDRNTSRLAHLEKLFAS